MNQSNKNKEIEVFRVTHKSYFFELINSKIIDSKQLVKNNTLWCCFITIIRIVLDQVSSHIMVEASLKLESERSNIISF